MKMKLSKKQWEQIGKTAGWDGWEPNNYLISMSRMIENIRGMDEGKVKALETKTGNLQKAFNILADFQDAANRI